MTIDPFAYYARTCLINEYDDDDDDDVAKLLNVRLIRDVSVTNN